MEVTPLELADRANDFRPWHELVFGRTLRDVVRTTPKNSQQQPRRRRAGADTRLTIQPQAPGDELIQSISEYDLRVGEVALALRSLVLRQAPTANEILFKSYVFAMTYTFTNRWTDGFCHIVVYRGHTNLGFNRGAELEDPEGVLVGSGKLIRHIRFERLEDLEKPYIRKLIKAAIRHSKSILYSKKATAPDQSLIKSRKRDAGRE